MSDSKEAQVLSSIANYSTVNMLELMALTPGLDDDEVRHTILDLQGKDLVSTFEDGDQEYVSLTSKGYDTYSSQMKLQMV